MYYALRPDGLPWSTGFNEADAPEGSIFTDEAGWNAANLQLLATQHAAIQAQPEASVPPDVEFTCECGRHYALPPNAQPVYIDGGP